MWVSFESVSKKLFETLKTTGVAGGLDSAAEIALAGGEFIDFYSPMR